MTDSMKNDLRRYLQSGRSAMLWKLDGLSEYDRRRPMTPTGTNLLGLVKHLAAVELGYFGWTFGRPCSGLIPWAESGGEPEVDMWATPSESTEYIVDSYRAICQHSDLTIEELDLGAQGVVPHWPEERATVTLHRIIVHVIADMDRHAGHADIIREMIDGSAGLALGNENMPSNDPKFWSEHCRRVEAGAREFL